MAPSDLACGGSAEAVIRSVSKHYRVQEPTEHLEVVDSTQKYLLERKAEYMMRTDYSDTLPLFAVSASHQTCGRGTAGRRWYSDSSSKCLALSMMFPISIGNLGKSSRITQVLGVSCIEAINHLTPPDCHHLLTLKWPNDLMVGSCKAGGILAESTPFSAEFHLIVIGVGINIDIDAGLLSRGVTGAHWPPVSLKSTMGIDIDFMCLRDRIITIFLRNLDVYFHAASFPIDPVFGIGRRFKFKENNRVITGVIVGIDETSGGLLLNPGSDSRLITMFSGEIIEFDNTLTI
jgi:biotin-[acetyl-CoA-carboxylase] ligase BirA-like protein